MALVNQIYSLVNDAVEDALGENSTLSDLDSTDLVSLGKAISSFDAYENFYVTVFQDGKEISLEEFILQNKDNFIHLVRLSASENFKLR